MDEGEDVGDEGQPLTAGDRLRAAREAAGLSLEDVATATRIPTRHLQSLESSDFARLPAPTYSVGFAKNYASAVGLDREEIGDQLRAELGGTRPPTATADLFEPTDPARAMPRWLIIAAVAAIVLAALIFTWLNNRSLEEPDEAIAENAVAPVVPAPAAPAPALGQGPVVITAIEQVWIQVEDGATTLREGLLEAGQSFEVPATATAPVLTTGKPEALRVTVGTAVAPPIGPPATTVTDVSLLPADLLGQRPSVPATATAMPPPAPATRTAPRTEPRPAPRRRPDAPVTEPESASPPHPAEANQTAPSPAQ